jgi:hypothetical protein
MWCLYIIKRHGKGMECGTALAQEKVNAKGLQHLITFELVD